MLKGGRGDQQLLVLIPLVMAAVLEAALSLTIAAVDLRSAPLESPSFGYTSSWASPFYYAFASIRTTYVRVERRYQKFVDDLLWVVHMKRAYGSEDPWRTGG